jgi:hypothetical protein
MYEYVYNFTFAYLSVLGCMQLFDAEADRIFNGHDQVLFFFLWGGAK